MIFTLVSDNGFQWLEFIASLVAGLVSAVVTVYAGIWAVSRTEFFRKTSAWEPYATSLWEARLNCFLEISQQLIYFERLAASMAKLADSFTTQDDLQSEEELKAAFWGYYDALSQSTDSIFLYAQTKTLIIHPNIETAIVDMFESMITFLEVSCSRMQTGLGMPVNLGHDDHPLPSKRKLDDAAQDVKQHSRIVLNLMRNELRLFHLNAATEDRFATITEQLSPVTMKRFVDGIIIKRAPDELG